MAKHQEPHIFTGMQRDMSISKHPSQFIYDGLNVRLTARGSDTLLSITNEQGTADTEMTVEGKYLGHCLLNKFLVVFTTDATNKKDYIYRIDLSREKDTGTENPNPKCLYDRTDGSLGFSTRIDAIASYESEAVQKVYWTDGVKQPRMINIAPSNDDKIEHYNSDSFDFMPNLTLNEEVVIKKVVGGGGMFAPGVIQYAFTYYNKYGQESNIFYTSPLLYISYSDRGGSPEDRVDNTFNISVSDLDDRFDYLRIYSIQRTSLNGTPICKRVQDIEIAKCYYDKDLDIYKTTFIDTGFTGDSIDPTELLYKGGESIVAKTLTQKDGTLFFGNIKIERENLLDVKENIENGCTVEVPNTGITGDDYRTIYYDANPSILYGNQLTSFGDENKTYSVPCGGFKYGDYYRCGVQFQHKTGKWSDPIFLDDVRMTNKPNYDRNNAGYTALTRFKGTLPYTLARKLDAKGYKKVRGVMVYPELQDRVTVCQGVACPTVYTKENAINHSPDRQSSWLFRPEYNYTSSGLNEKNGTCLPGISIRMDDTTLTDYLHYTDLDSNFTPPIYDPTNIRQVEIQGNFIDKDGGYSKLFKLDTSTVTFHSPDIEFDSSLQIYDYYNIQSTYAGKADFALGKTFSIIDLQTETPNISEKGSGFIKEQFITDGGYGIVSGPFYEDFLVDDYDEADPKYRAYDKENSPVKWIVYMWNKSGSLNNDINRPANKGTRSAVLKKKIISNCRIAATVYSDAWNLGSNENNTEPKIQAASIFSSEEVSVVKIEGDDSVLNVYQGNVDTLLNPPRTGSQYFAFDNITSSIHDMQASNIVTSFDSTNWWRTYSDHRLYKWTTHDKWKYDESDIGDYSRSLVEFKESVRMKYKSTPHLVAKFDKSVYPVVTPDEQVLPIYDLGYYSGGTPEKLYYRDTMFGGTTEDALKANNWIPVGEPVPLNLNDNKPTTFYYDYGDTYYQRWDCLKTYPFTDEDINQVVEIGSFMLETRVNIDGRYDRNRGQLDNTMMSPRNFNLINHVYSQTNNFFTYKILSKDYYKNNEFSNQITWTKEKQSGADVDLWTNITLASTYDLDGSKGKIVSLNTWKDNIYCFQNKCVSNILFNSRVQIPASDGVPIEISNNYKVDGYRSISDGIGCNDQWLIKETPSGIYFIDSVGNHLMHLSDGMQDLSEKCNMTTWFKANADSIEKIVYDDINHDIYMVSDTDGKTLCFSEKLNQFTGFYDYEDISLIETYGGHVFTMKDEGLYKMFEGSYGNFFGVNKPWSLTFISNGINENNTTTDKIFTNLEFRATVEDDGELNQNTGKFTPTLPLDYMETWNEYQHGTTILKPFDGHKSMVHHDSSGEATLKRKFRIWRCDIPRNNAALDSDEGLPNLFRKIRKPLDRMRNPWLYVKLKKDEAEERSYLKRTELHDLILTYFG